MGTLYSESWCPWENGYIESFNGELRDELLGGEIFGTVREAKVLIERWRNEYNKIRPHSLLGYRPPIRMIDSLTRRCVRKGTGGRCGSCLLPEDANNCDASPSPSRFGGRTRK